MMTQESIISLIGVNVVHAISGNVEYCLALRGPMLRWSDDILEMTASEDGVDMVRMCKYSSEALFELTTKQHWPNESMLELRWLSLVDHSIPQKEDITWPF